MKRITSSLLCPGSANDSLELLIFASLLVVEVLGQKTNDEALKARECDQNTNERTFKVNSHKANENQIAGQDISAAFEGGMRLMQANQRADLWVEAYNISESPLLHRARAGGKSSPGNKGSPSGQNRLRRFRRLNEVARKYFFLLDEHSSIYLFNVVNFSDWFYQPLFSLFFWSRRCTVSQPLF